MGADAAGGKGARTGSPGRRRLGRDPFPRGAGFAKKSKGHATRPGDDTQRPAIPHSPAASGPAPLSRRAGLAILASLLLAPAPSRAAAEPPAGPDKPAPRVIAVFGDSQAEGLAVALRRATRSDPGVRVQNRTKAGTAIGQADNYDWPAAIRDYAPDPGVDTAVMMFGGNDRLPIRLAPGTVLPFRGASWEAEYRARVAAMLRSLADKGLRVIWVGNPVCRDPKYSGDMEYLNGLFQQAIAGGAAGADGAGAKARYLDIWTAVADAAGRFSAYGKALDGASARLRLDDGIHFTPAGYDIVAAKVMKAASAGDAA